MSGPRRSPSGVTEAVAARYREILPSSFVVETSGPILNVKGPGIGNIFFGNFVLHFPFLPAKYRLEQFAKLAFGDLLNALLTLQASFRMSRGPPSGRRAMCVCRATRSTSGTATPTMRMRLF